MGTVFREIELCIQFRETDKKLNLAVGLSKLSTMRLAEANMLIFGILE